MGPCYLRNAKKRQIQNYFFLRLLFQFSRFYINVYLLSVMLKYQEIIKLFLEIAFGKSWSEPSKHPYLQIYPRPSFQLDYIFSMVYDDDDDTRQHVSFYISKNKQDNSKNSCCCHKGNGRTLSLCYFSLNDKCRPSSSQLRADISSRKVKVNDIQASKNSTFLWHSLFMVVFRKRKMARVVNMWI